MEIFQETSNQNENFERSFLMNILVDSRLADSNVESGGRRKEFGIFEFWFLVKEVAIAMSERCKSLVKVQDESWELSFPVLEVAGRQNSQQILENDRVFIAMVTAISSSVPQTGDRSLVDACTAVDEFLWQTFGPHTRSSLENIVGEDLDIVFKRVVINAATTSIIASHPVFKCYETIDAPEEWMCQEIFDGQPTVGEDHLDDMLQM